MHAFTSMVAIAAATSTALAEFQGFNYGSTFNNGAPKQQSDYEAEFKTARDLVDAPADGFTSARLYTMIQAGTAFDPISAIPAAIATKTSLLLGMWCSAGEYIMNNEVRALLDAVDRYGSDFTKLVAGISVGSEDLYRISPTGLKNGENPGAEPAMVAQYIKKVRDAVAHTSLSAVPIGHVDTWTAWVNASNQEVIDACDWVGVDAYPYFQETQVNSIANSKSLFNAAFDATKAAVSGRPVWVTETGYPVRGKTVGQALPSLANAKTYWDEVGCPLFGNTNIWWYTFQDSAPDFLNTSFGVIGRDLTTTPLFDISCKNIKTLSPVPVSDGGIQSVSGTNTTVPTGVPRQSVTPDTTPSGATSISSSISAAFAAMIAAIIAI